MALTREQSIALYGTEKYVAWGEAEAAADAKAKGIGTPAGGGGGADDILQNAINSILKLIPQPLKPYEEANPFFFDEALAKEASIAEYAPYYGELLSDYIADVEMTKGRSQEDLDRTLAQLLGGKEYYMGVERRALDKSLRQTNEGYAGKGLFFSGVRERDRKELETEYGARTGEYLRGYKYGVSGAKLATTRLGETAEIGQKRYTRDIERAKEEAIAGGVLTRKGETREEYEISRKKYYQTQYPGYYGGIG